MNFRLSPSCQFFFHSEVTRIARVYKHAATNDNSLDLHPFNRKLALVGIIPRRILFSFSSDKDQRPWQACVRIPAGLRCVLSSDPAVSSSIFVGAEREENLIRRFLLRMWCHEFSRSHAKVNIRCMHVVLVKENHSYSKLNMFTGVETRLCIPVHVRVLVTWQRTNSVTIDRVTAFDHEAIVRIRTMVIRSFCGLCVILNPILKANIPLERSRNFLNEDILFVKIQ